MIEVHRRVVWTRGLCKVVWMGTNQRKGDWNDKRRKDLDDKEMERSAR
jgi:hypothetical protein